MSARADLLARQFSLWTARATLTVGLPLERPSRVEHGDNVRWAFGPFSLRIYDPDPTCQCGLRASQHRYETHEVHP